MRKFVIGLAATLSMTSMPARAEQPFAVTLSSEVKPVFRSGKIGGCALNFEVGRQDAEYNQGEMVYISGSLNYYVWDDSAPFFALKLGVKSDLGGEFVAPADAYLVSGLSTNVEDSSGKVPSETQGFSLFTFRLGDATSKAAIEEVGETGTLTFSYAMRPGGMNAIVPVDLRIRNLNLDDLKRSEINESAPIEWFDCLEKAILTQTE